MKSKLVNRNGVLYVEWIKHNVRFKVTRKIAGEWKLGDSLEYHDHTADGYEQIYYNDRGTQVYCRNLAAPADSD